MRVFRSLMNIRKFTRCTTPIKAFTQGQFLDKMHMVSSSCLLTRHFSELKKTSLYPAHIQMKGLMVDWAGYALPMQYVDGIYESHLHVREHAGLFDMSHCGQLLIQGNDHIKFLESLIVSDLKILEEDQGCNSLLTNQNGGIIGDCIIFNKSDHLFMIISPECKGEVLKYMKKQLKLWNKDKKSSIVIEKLDKTLMSLQGPKAAEVLDELVKEDLSTMGFISSINSKIKEIDCLIYRYSYTGEDGFEISVNNENALDILNFILSNPHVQPQGQVVRDTLRLEAGLCLYPHDYNSTITPNEANLINIVGKRRLKKGGFPGHSTIKKQLEESVKRTRIGLVVEKGKPVKTGCEILSQDGKEIGIITSSTYSPCLQQNIAMGYIDTQHSAVGTKIAVKNHETKFGPARVVKMPFIPTN